jgi:hypothetical protein
MAPPEDIKLPKPKAKPRTDWEAVERDYRATNLTLRELADKHGCSHSAIANQVTRKGWVRDLSDAVRMATSAMLIESAISGNVTKTVQDVTNAVLVTADINTRVILSHRTRLSSLNDAVETAKAKLLTLGETVADIREAAAFVQAVGNLASATKTLIEQERRNHGLDDAPPGGDDKAAHTVKVKFV